MTTWTRCARAAAPLVLAWLGATTGAHAAALIQNGGFESGFSHWTRVDQAGSEGGFSLQSGTASPLNLDPVPAPPEGSQAAMTDAFGPGAHVLFQDFVAVATNALLSFDLFIGNRADLFFSPASLAFDLTSQVGSQTLNQQVRVDILKASADPFSVAAADILMTLVQTMPGDTPVSGYTTFTTDLTALLAANAGQTLRLRFAETDNLGPLQLGVDNVSLGDRNTVPEPATGLLAAAALLGLRGLRARRWLASGVAATVAGLAAMLPLAARADTTALAILDPNLQVDVVLSTGVTQPIGIVFLGRDDFFVLEKATGQVKRVINGVLQANPVLDLAVNSNSERGLLSLVLHPNFPTVPHVYVRWTESSTGADSTVVSQVPLLGNRVDRFTWNGTSLVFDSTLLRLRARQTDNIATPNHPGTNNINEAGNHNGGVMRFGPDGKLYVFMGDLGRRGWLQNLANGPFLTAPLVDDTFGGPEPDDAHLTGVILRLNDDGTTPPDNPFYVVGASLGGQAGANLQKIFSYGHRNGFGMAFDPMTGYLWASENADDAYSELNRVVPGLNGGWIQLAGPMSRMADWKRIEALQFNQSLQQVRYPPTRAAYNGTAAASRLFMLPGAVYKDPELSWRYEIGPSGAAFVSGNALGPEYNGTLWMGSARSFGQVGANGGSLYRLKLSVDRLSVDTSADPRLADKVADNLFRAQKFEGTESETMVIGRGFGTTTSIEQGPDGNLYVVSLTDNTIYRIRRAVP